MPFFRANVFADSSLRAKTKRSLRSICRNVVHAICELPPSALCELVTALPLDKYMVIRRCDSNGWVIVTRNAVEERCISPDRHGLEREP
jgi:hypothetical protein